MNFQLTYPKHMQHAVFIIILQSVVKASTNGIFVRPNYFNDFSVKRKKTKAFFTVRQKLRSTLRDTITTITNKPAIINPFIKHMNHKSQSLLILTIMIGLITQSTRTYITDTMLHYTDTMLHSTMYMYISARLAINWYNPHNWIKLYSIMLL